MISDRPDRDTKAHYPFINVAVEEMLDFLEDDGVDVRRHKRELSTFLRSEYKRKREE